MKKPSPPPNTSPELKAIEREKAWRAIEDAARIKGLKPNEDVRCRVWAAIAKLILQRLAIHDPDPVRRAELQKSGYGQRDGATVARYIAERMKDIDPELAAASLARANAKPRGRKPDEALDDFILDVADAFEEWTGQIARIYHDAFAGQRTGNFAWYLEAVANIVRQDLNGSPAQLPPQSAIARRAERLLPLIY